MKKHVLLLPLALPACFANAQEYKPPAGAPQATIVFHRAKEPLAVMVMRFFTDAANCSGLTGLPGRGRPFWEGQPLQLEAGKEFAFAFRDIKSEILSPYTAQHTRCDLVVSFVLQPDGRYKLTYDRSEDGKECSLSLVRLEDAGGPVRKVPEPAFRKREPQYSYSADAPACKPHSPTSSGGGAAATNPATSGQAAAQADAATERK